jgi:hypothetical protein
MSISGHETNSTYKRSGIIDENLQRECLERVHEQQQCEVEEWKVVPIARWMNSDKTRDNWASNKIRINLIEVGEALTGDQEMRVNSLLDQKKCLAERVGFEPTLPFRVNLISSQAPSAGLGHLSAIFQLLSRSLCGSQSLCMNVVNLPAELSRENLHHLFVRRVHVPLVNRSTAMAGRKLAQLFGDVRHCPTGTAQWRNRENGGPLFWPFVSRDQKLC